ncbi:hypothetical protein [Granulicoccus phenolivorans]|uniref:hypothetical protein n=1 Tax=Granulicoccus phenolivorans TaxID=266854 RepID=UPI0003F683A7|nr:hypothetical protein [Granulicoccus phenolivorans]
MFGWHASTNADGSGATPLEARFADQAEAEEWLSANFEELLEQGLASVTLYEEDRLVYGPMSLLPQ